MRRLRIPARLLLEGVSQRAECGPHGDRESFGRRCECQPFSSANEKWITKSPTKSRKRIAHRRLAEANAARSASHMALLNEGLEGQQQVQVNGAKIHTVNSAYYHN